MNKVMLIGRLTKDPELSETASGIACCRFTLAVNRDFKNANGEREADFISVIVWRAKAENCGKYLRKGDRAGVVGRLQITQSEGKDGVKRYYTDVVADDVEFLQDKRSDGQSNAAPPPKPEQTRMGTLEPIYDDDLPF